MHNEGWARQPNARAIERMKNNTRRFEVKAEKARRKHDQTIIQATRLRVKHYIFAKHKGEAG